jgi:hypothetical protein
MRDDRLQPENTSQDENDDATMDAFTERCLELDRSQPDTPVDLFALCWASSNAPASAPGKEALGILKGVRLDNAESEELSKVLDNPQKPMKFGQARWPRSFST